ncbi:ABC transporter permease [Actinoalloteichus caeruleus]|uniref:ABC transporter permease n=1 Tax=Actinoalloteichus cyanogriseus TaxID=2893586 RepID=UPI0004A9FE6E|nr:ABC transporter permease [Actinoalloteichus caeruleus]
MTPPTTTTRPEHAGPGTRDGRSGRPRLPGAALPAVTVLGVLLLAELVSRLGVLPTRYFPPASEMFVALAGQVVDPSFWVSVGQTLQGWGAGLGIAVLLAVPVGLALGTVPLLYTAVRPIVEFLRPIPSVALIPLVVLAIGTGAASKVFLAAFAAFWQLLIPVIYGVRDTDPVARDTGRAFRLGRFGVLRWIVLPAAVPYLATGLRIASATALILAVTAELVIGVPGLGGAINLARSAGAPDRMYALIIATGLLGWGLNAAFRAVERRVLHWHPSHREAAA